MEYAIGLAIGLVVGFALCLLAWNWAEHKQTIAKNKRSQAAKKGRAKRNGQVSGGAGLLNQEGFHTEVKKQTIRTNGSGMADHD